ncbi:MAG: elongation factor P [candidate division KSB1 bacterium]|nr:elongation factor P [candidate division KSB1 bacterium]MDZ7345533.1 elongation factor P [candidate division KSB1 bacterium]
MVTTADFKTGLIIKVEDELYSIVEFQHVKMARGSAFTRTKIKSLQSGRVLERTFRGSDKFEAPNVERRQMQFLYRDGNLLICMDNVTFEQITIAETMMTPSTEFLKEGQQVTLLLNGETPIAAEMPNFVELEVIETEPGFKGDTVSGAVKPAVVETGGRVMVPLFVEVGDVIKIDTRSSTYLERVNR